MRLTDEQIQTAAKMGSQLYGEVAKVLVRWLDRVPIDEYESAAQEVGAFSRMAESVLELMAERLNAIAEVAEVAGSDDEALVVLLKGMVATSRAGVK
jgi:hypothetical protein